MPADAQLANKRIETDNKIQMENGFYDGEIIQSRLQWVKNDGKTTLFVKTREEATGQKHILVVKISDDIKLNAEFFVGCSPKKPTIWQKFISTFSGIPVADINAIYDFDEKDLVGVKVECELLSEEKQHKTTHEEYFYTKVTSIIPAERVKKSVTPKPKTTTVVPAGLRDDYDRLVEAQKSLSKTHDEPTEEELETIPF